MFGRVSLPILVYSLCLGLLGNGAGVKSEDTIGGAPPGQTRNQRDESDPAPRRLRPNENECDQNSSNNDSQGAINGAQIAFHVLFLIQVQFTMRIQLRGRGGQRL